MNRTYIQTIVLWDGLSGAANYMRRDRSRPARGFTLLELLIVMTIIGILIGFILVAAADGVRRAEEKATLALITKLEIGLSERMEAILVRRGDVYPSHVILGGIASGGTFIGSAQRAQVMAQFDLLRSELPDFFVVDTANGHYPLNFGQPSAFAPATATAAFPAGVTGDWSVPLGAYNQSNLYTSFGVAPVNQPPALPAAGAYGATWGAMGGILKNLGYLPKGYDGIDNNGNGMIDDFTEGAPAGSTITFANGQSTATSQDLKTVILTRLGSHRPNTARSEMLYALLVEGQGPLGSIFNRDEFTAREVRDTDGDNLPEFVDAWGQPLQFYRWPIFYNPDFNNAVTSANYIQKGLQPYSNLLEPRQLDPLDPGQLLMSPAWFDATVNLNTLSGFGNGSGGSGPATSSCAHAFEVFFHTLHDPTGTSWDRSGAYSRRAFYSRPLILSSGPDKLLGVANYLSIPSGATPLQFVSAVMQNESAANPLTAVQPSDDPSGSLGVNSLDDISNFSLSSATGGSR